jgi:hypothetical protein
MTRPGSWLVESLAKRDVSPDVTGRSKLSRPVRVEREERRGVATGRTIEYAFHIQREEAVPSVLLREAVGWGSKTDREGLEKDPRKRQKIKTFDALIVWRAPRHAGVIDEDVDLVFLGLDGLDEVVASSLGLNIEKRQPSDQADGPSNDERNVRSGRPRCTRMTRG